MVLKYGKYLNLIGHLFLDWDVLEVSGYDETFRKRDRLPFKMVAQITAIEDEIKSDLVRQIRIDKSFVNVSI